MDWASSPYCLSTCTHAYADTNAVAGTTGLRTWQASVRLANHLLAHPELVRHKGVLELGSGAGMLSALSGKLQAVGNISTTAAGKTTATDRDGAVLERLKANLAASELQSPFSRKRARRR